MNTIESRLETIYAESNEHFTKEPIVQTTYLVNGELREAGATERISTPLTVEGTYGQAPSMTEEESLAVLASSKEAWNEGTGEWPMSSIPERVAAVRAFVEEMKTIREPVVTDLMYEIAKNKTDAEKEFDRTIEYIEKTCDEALQFKPIYKTHPGGLKTRTDKMPLGETICMSPYNYPLNETFTTLIAALIMGNPVILKPARHGVLFRRHFAPLFQKHFPAGVVNMIYGDGKTIVGPIMKTGDIDALAFIGSSPVGKAIAHQHPDTDNLRQVKGLGAKNAYIVTKTADIDQAVKDALLGAFSFNGQRCTANKMLFVASEIYDVFMAKLKDAIEKITIGMSYGWYTTVHDDKVHYDPKVIPFITPLPEPGKVAAMKAFIDEALDKGATFLNKDGGKAFHQLMVPTILEGVTSDMSIYHKEQFGPVLPAVKFDDIQTPIERIRKINFGQQVSIYSTNPHEIMNVFNAVSTQQGRMNINSMCQRGPDDVAFSATKGSAVGTLSYKDSLLKFSRDRVVAENPTNGKYFFVNDEGEEVYLSN